MMRARPLTLKCWPACGLVALSLAGLCAGAQSPAPAPKPAPAAPNDARKAAATAAPAPAPADPAQAQLVADTQRLLKLSEELKAEVAKSNKDTLSLSVIKKADEIEKLAKSLKERMNKSH